jgi:hypothetical protein
MVWMSELKSVTITTQRLLMDVISVRLKLVGIVLLYWTKQARARQFVEMVYEQDQSNAVSITASFL